ncbi:MAG: PatB family C-S lyase [Tannerella sp.]|jgi:cystathionine beta-lyase|nr:PatB family C-S lyase [Tannerella sp.]
MKKYCFDEMIERRGTDCLKYDCLDRYFGKKDLMPFWVADMDFRTPDFIVDALKERCEHPVFGYTFPSDAYGESIRRWVDALYGWDIRSEWLSFIPGVVKGIALALECFTRPGDGVIIQPPVYHPFRIVPESLRRRVVYNPLRLRDGVYEMDFEQLESVIDRGCRALILSSPHNPAGIVWKKETLQKLAEVCRRRRLLVIADEIHAEMVYPSFTHHPFPTVSSEAADCSITFMAPSKTFNIAGIVSSYAIVPDDVLRSTFYAFLKAGEFHEGTIFSYIAATAAYTHGAEWRRQMLDYVRGNMSLVDTFLGEYLPQIKLYPPQASFLAWLDCRELGLSQQELVRLIVDEAGLAFNNGTTFGKEGTGYVRMNVGCPRSLVGKALYALKQAVENHKRRERVE